jgi:transposase
MTFQRRIGYGDVEKYMYFDKLSNDEWLMLQPLIEQAAVCRLNRRGRPRAELRVVANAVLWVMTTGEPWSRIPYGYPSVPTCRRRFDEWLENGTLSAMADLLSKQGRTFAFVPATSSPDSGHAAPQSPRFLRSDGAPHVLWKSADAWQTVPGTMDRARETTPFAEIARRLSGEQNNPHIAPEAGPGEEEDPALQADRTGFSRWMGLLSRGKQVSHTRGYVIYAAADSLADGSFRGWADIAKDGRRVVRSGLIGPSFVKAEAGQQYALSWACKWIDQHCPVLTVTETLRVGPVLKAMPLPQPVAKLLLSLEQDEFFSRTLISNTN